MTKSFKRHLITKCIQDNYDWKNGVNIQTKSSSENQSKFELVDVVNISNHKRIGMDLSRLDDKQIKDQISLGSINSSNSKSTGSESSSRSNSVDGIKISDNEFLNSANVTAINQNNHSLNSSNFGSSPYITSNNTITSSTSSNAAYNVSMNQDFLLRMAMQNNTSVNNTITNNNMFHNLYQNALNQTTTSSNGSNGVINSTNAITAHHLAALNSHNSAFQNLQQNHAVAVAHQQLNNQQANQQNDHSVSSTATNSTLNQNTNVLPNADHLLSTMNGTNRSLLAVANGLINNPASISTNGLTTNSLSSSLSTNGSTNSSGSNSSLTNNSQMIINEHFLNNTNSLINQNSILASQSAFVPSLIDSSANNLLCSIKKRKRSPQPIPQDLKDDAYWDRRRRNNESAKRSREVRRIKEHQTAMRLMFLEKKNLQLETELEMMKEEAKKMHDIIYCQRYGQDNQKDKHM